MLKIPAKNGGDLY